MPTKADIKSERNHSDLAKLPFGHKALKKGYAFYMNKGIMKNIEKAKVLELAALVTYQDGQVVSKTLVQNSAVSMTLFAFDQDEEISSHSSHGDALVTVLDGQAEITVGAQKYTLSAGETIVMPAEVPHAVFAPIPMKFMLSVVF